MNHGIKDHAGSGLDGPPPQNLGSRIVQKLAGFMHTATHPDPAPEQIPEPASKPAPGQSGTA